MTFVMTCPKERFASVHGYLEMRFTLLSVVPKLGGLSKSTSFLISALSCPVLSCSILQSQSQCLYLIEHINDTQTPCTWTRRTSAPKCMAGGSVSLLKKALPGGGRRRKEQRLLLLTGGGMSAEKGQYCRLITY